VKYHCFDDDNNNFFLSRNPLCATHQTYDITNFMHNFIYSSETSQ